MDTENRKGFTGWFSLTFLTTAPLLWPFSPECTALNGNLVGQSSAVPLSAALRAACTVPE